MARQPTIVALGGGGLSNAPFDRLLDDFVLSLTGVERPRICLVPTAGGDHDCTIVDFYATFKGRPVVATHLPLFRRDDDSIEELLLAQDAILVPGGNTANMLAIWRVHGVDRAIRKAWESGVVLAGASAGSICWFEGGTTDSFGTTLAPITNALGFLPGSNCPHYDGEPQRRPLFQRLVGEGALPAGYAADDHAGLVFRGRELAEVVSARPGATGYRVERVDGRAVETPLPARQLGA